MSEAERLARAIHKNNELCETCGFRCSDRELKGAAKIIQAALDARPQVPWNMCEFNEHCVCIHCHSRRAEVEATNGLCASPRPRPQASYTQAEMDAARTEAHEAGFKQARAGERLQVDGTLEEAADSAAEEIVESNDVGVTVYDIILKHIAPIVSAMVAAACEKMREDAAEMGGDVAQGFVDGLENNQTLDTDELRSEVFDAMRNLPIPHADTLDALLREREAAVRLQEAEKWHAKNDGSGGARVWCCERVAELEQTLADIRAGKGRT